MSLPKKFAKVGGGTSKSKIFGSGDDILPVLTNSSVKKMRENAKAGKKKAPVVFKRKKNLNK